jgi:putative hydrolase
MIRVRDLFAQDMHVHSTFSDGRDALTQNIAQAELVGLHEMTCVDHVRQDTSWASTFAAAVVELSESTPVRLRCGVEAKLLDTSGRLDLPVGLTGVDVVYAADHQVPMHDGPHTPTEIGTRLSAAELTTLEVLESIIASTGNALSGPRPIVIAHLFSVLPKLGLSEAQVPIELIEMLAAEAADAGASIEVDERWSCPSARTVAPFLRRGVPLLLSTDSHRCETIGRYEYCRTVVAELLARGLLAD